MHVLFAHSFFMAFDDKQQVVKEPYPPLGTLIAAACARNAGHVVDLFDAMIASGPAAFASKLKQGSFEAVVFFEDNFNWLSKMCLARMRRACGEMIAMAREKQALVLVAGSDASDFPRVFLEMGADYVIKGEAEFRILEILDHHGRGADQPFSGAGIFKLEPGGMVGEFPRRGERNLEVFPKPAWDLVDMAGYRRIWTQRHGYFSLNMMTTRGCPYRCNWCAKPIHGKRYDVRDAAAVAAEMAELKALYQPDHIWFTDDIFGLKPKWVERFAAEVERLDGRIPFKIQARADLMSADTVAALSRAGCRTVWMGVESGSQKVLDAMDKDLRVADIDAASARLKAAGIEVCFFLQFGYPGEGADEIRQTWDMIARARPDQIGISVAYPLPGTPFYEKVKDQISVRDHWEHSQDMEPIHEATFPRGFYPLLYRYIHQRFGELKGRRRRGIGGLADRLRRWRTRAQLKRFGIAGVPFP